MLFSWLDANCEPTLCIHVFDHVGGRHMWSFSVEAAPFCNLMSRCSSQLGKVQFRLVFSLWWLVWQLGRIFVTVVVHYRCFHALLLLPLNLVSNQISFPPLLVFFPSQFHQRDHLYIFVTIKYRNELIHNLIWEIRVMWGRIAIMMMPGQLARSGCWNSCKHTTFWCVRWRGREGTE